MNLIFFKGVRYLEAVCKLQTFCELSLRVHLWSLWHVRSHTPELTGPLLFRVDLIFGNSQKIFEAASVK